jgi:hypothetical protein
MRFRLDVRRQVVLVDSQQMPDHDGSSERDLASAIDAAQQQLDAAARSTVEEHLTVVAQRRVDQEIEAMRASGVWKDGEVRYEVTVRPVRPTASR